MKSGRKPFGERLIETMTDGLACLREGRPLKTTLVKVVPEADREKPRPS